MKKFLRVSILIFFLGAIIYPNTEAKVLPIIEGSELLDTLASQNNEEINMPELSAGIYNHADFKHMLLYIDKYPSMKMDYNGKCVSCYSKIDLPFDSFFYLIPNNKIRFTGQILFQYYLENI